MSKYIVRIATVAVIAMALALPAFAKGDKGAKTPAVVGTLKAVDTTANTVTVTTTDGDKVIKTDASTKVRAGTNKDATVADLKVGAEVTVICKGDVAASISQHGKKK